MPVVSSSLDTQETSLSRPPPADYRQYIAVQYGDEPGATEQLYYTLDGDGEGTSFDRFANCRKYAFFVRHVRTGELRIHANHCRLRWCPYCAHSKSMIVASNVTDWIRSVSGAKLLTLTLKSSNNPLAFQLESLLKSWRRFRSLAPMSKGWRGGVWFLQITFNRETEQWHPHLHILIDGDFIPQKLLSLKWLTVTKTSNILDVRSVNSPDKVGQYVSRYVARPCLLTSLYLEQRIILYSALHGRRLCGTFGSMKGVNLTSNANYDPSQWQRIGSYREVIILSESDDNAKRILNAWRKHRPLPEGICLSAYGPLLGNNLRTSGLDPPMLQLTIPDIDREYHNAIAN